LICTGCACVSVFGAKALLVNVWMGIGSAVLFYAVGVIVTRQIKVQDIIYPK